MTAFFANEFDLHRLADDGCTHHADDLDDTPVAVLGGLLREVAPGLFKREGAPVVLWSVEDCSGFTLLLVCVDKR